MRYVDSIVSRLLSAYLKLSSASTTVDHVDHVDQALPSSHCVAASSKCG